MALMEERFNLLVFVYKKREKLGNSFGILPGKNDLLNSDWFKLIHM